MTPPTTEILPAVPDHAALEATVQDVFHGDLPASMEQIARNIAVLKGIGHLANLGLAIQIAHAHNLLDTEREWLDWGFQEFGQTKQHLHRMRRIGEMLLAYLRDAEVARVLLPVAIGKLDPLAALHARKPEQFEGFIRLVNPESHTREQIRAKVNAFLQEPGNPDPEPEPTKAPPTPRGPNWDGMLAKFAQLWGDDADDQKALIAGTLGPGVGMRAALVILEMTLYHVVEHGDWADEDFRFWRDKLQAAVRMMASIDPDHSEAASEDS